MSNDFISGFLLAWMMAALWWLGMFLWMWSHRDRPLETATKDEPDPKPDLSDWHPEDDPGFLRGYIVDGTFYEGKFIEVGRRNRG